MHEYRQCMHHLYTMRRYKYLNKEDVHNSEVAYHSKNIADKYVFQRSSLDISYLVCDTIEEFYKYYSDKRPCSRMYNEVINDNWRKQKFKLDIDGRIGSMEMEHVLRTIRKIFRKLTKIRPDILVYDISTSYHIIVTNICFPSSMCCEMVANAIAEKLSTVSSLIDLGVYKKLQMFRIEGSTKYKQRRWKYVDGSKELSDLDIFKKGIITYTNDCHVIDEDRVVDIMLDMHIYAPETQHKVPVSNRMYIPKEFTIRKTINGLIVLDRIQPSFCEVCKRIHDNENAYMVGRKLHCRRTLR